ncbi:restriction endonuclease [Noviherbaspirillum autotrophicum]|uniref:restriction endonuclease n=1 Tax=Noviherbaspirillum autotrophicum TaxID=709839 RepID=UPI000AA7B4A6|nr:restriction endonuclease [Noviherbaspirillum autotrophicum]
MAEPVSPTAGLAIAAGTITLSGTFLGVHYDALLAGFFGGLVSLSYLPSMPKSKIASTVASSSILAGYFAPVIAITVQHYFSFLEGVGDFMRLASAAGLGVSAQVVIPVALNWIRTKGGAQ